MNRKEEECKEGKKIRIYCWINATDNIGRKSQQKLRLCDPAHVLHLLR